MTAPASAGRRPPRRAAGRAGRGRRPHRGARAVRASRPGRGPGAGRRAAGISSTGMVSAGKSARGGSSHMLRTISMCRVDRQPPHRRPSGRPAGWPAWRRPPSRASRVPAASRGPQVVRPACRRDRWPQRRCARRPGAERRGRSLQPPSTSASADTRAGCAAREPRPRRCRPTTARRPPAGREPSEVITTARSAAAAAVEKPDEGRSDKPCPRRSTA